MVKKRKKERRRPIVCSYCGQEMVCMKKFELERKQPKLYVWYVCPRRRNEKGCGWKLLYEVSPVIRRSPGRKTNA